MKPFLKVMLAALLVVVLAACGGGKDNGNGGGDGSGVTDPIIARPGDDEQQPDGQDDDATGVTDNEGGQEAAAPPQTIELEMSIEGFTETRTATLAESDNGYYMYTLPQFVFTPEEPGVDQVFLQAYGDYFMRIMPLAADVNADEVKAGAMEELQALTGAEISELAAEDISNDFISERTLFYFHAVKSGDISKHIMLLDIDGMKFKVTIHLPHGEAIEGSSAGFNAMIPTIRPAAGE